MRLSTFSILVLVLVSACKTTRESRSTEASLDSLENEEELPDCDDITVGRVYWVQSLNTQVQCMEGGAWQPHPGFGPRSIQ